MIGYQDKLQSKILRAGLIALIIFITKKYWGYDIDSEFVSIIIDIALGAILGLAIWNNPNDKLKI